VPVKEIGLMGRKTKKLHLAEAERSRSRAESN